MLLRTAETRPPPPITWAQPQRGPAGEVAGAPRARANLVAVVVHGDQAVDVVDVAASGQLAHQLRLDRWLQALVA